MRHTGGPRVVIDDVGLEGDLTGFVDTCGAVATYKAEERIDASHPCPGERRIEERVGGGGMGAVYLGRTEGAAGFAKPVVIKQILPALVAISMPP